MLPMAVPGLVLGLGYIFFFNAPANPLNGLYHTIALLTLCTIVHFYTTGHLTAVTALKSLDAEFEAVSASLKVPFYKTFWRVTLPICTPALVDIARYFFINAMTTISAVVFLYSPETKVAVDRDPEPRRGRRHRRRGGDGGADRRRLDRRDAALHAARPLGRAAHAGLEACRPRRTDHTPERQDTMDRDPILLTPGPLTTTLRTKLAMLQGLGLVGQPTSTPSRRACARSCSTSCTATRRMSSCPLQGSGTFSVEAAVATVVPRDGHVLVLDNGAYCKRAAKLTQMMGRRASVLAFAEDEPVSAAALDARLAEDASITHVILIHCETGTGVLNPFADVAAVCERHGKGPDRRCDELVRRDRRSTRARCASTPWSRPAASAWRVCRAWASCSCARRSSTAAPATARAWRWTCTTSTSTWRRPASGASRRRRT